MTFRTRFLRAVTAAAAAALIIGPSVAITTRASAESSTDSGNTAELRAPEAEHETLAALRAPARPLSTHPKVDDDYIAPTQPSDSSAQGFTAAAAAKASFAAAAAPASARTWGDAGSSKSTLVLYDTTDAFGWLGELYGIAAGNLASHFGQITAEPVVDYQAGQVNDFTAVIYLGSTYNEPIPVSFLTDVLATTTPVVWAGDNIWQLAGTPEAATAFQATYGWDLSTSYFDDVDTVTQVLYNGQTLTRNASAGLILAPHITSTTPGQVTVLGDAQCGTVTAPVACAPIAEAPVGSTTYPWAIRSANLTYIGEIPLSYMNETDRYLAFSDLLYTVLDPTAPVVRQALVRLEDVSPGINTPEQLMAIADYLSSANVPFSVAVIPAYADPNGFYNGGTPENMDISQTGNPTIAAFNDALRYMVSKGGTLIEHGNTHQFSNVPNPYTGVSGDDFEFYRSQCSSTQNPPYSFHAPCLDSDWIIQEGPLASDSASFAQSRVAAGKALFAPAGLPTPYIWETPHYSASAVDYSAFNAVYQTRYEREQFFGGQLTGITANSSHVFGQFFPFVVHDVYGTTMIPESIANFEPEAVNHTAARLAPAIIANVQAELAVRQGVASFFFHPYYPIADLQQIVEGIQGLGYTFVAPTALVPAPPVTPAVTSVAPTTGSTVGGTSVTITGTNLAGATNVSFGGTAATIVSNTATQIVATSPAHAAGLIDVRVTTPGGTSAVVPGDQYTYVAPPGPAITLVAPNSGPATGATQVTITGTNLGGATAVAFGTTAATIVSNTATQIVVTSPAHALGRIDVRVTTPSGTSPVANADRFTYVAPPAPTVTGIAPNSGPIAGGTSVTITGTNFTGATLVRFGSTNATIVSTTATQIVATSPAHQAGLVDVRVTTPGGQSGTNAADRFTYLALPLPTLTSVSPNSGPVTGGTTVTITGTNLTGATTVAFGTTTATIVSNTETEIVATSPAHQAGVVDVRVRTAAGTSATSTADRFTYVRLPVPAVTSVSPNVGPATGGTTVTITGTNLAGAAAVAFGTTTATIVSNTETEIVATSPAHQAGRVDVRVRTAAGTSPTATADRFTYVVTTTTVNSSPSANQIRVGSPATFTATITASGGTASSATGTVSFTQDNATLSGCDAVAVSAARATCTVTYTSAGIGTHVIRATYSGDSSFPGSTGTRSIRVR